ncbi:MAG: hypothetical protein V8T10_02815 [Merdibacter sp.]
MHWHSPWCSHCFITCCSPRWISAGARQTRTLYLNQVGIYAESENAQKICEQLKEKGLTPYQVEEDGRQIVMTSVYEEEDKTEEEGKKLEEMELAYITKKITVEGEEMSTAVDEQDYQKVLQAMKDESARDES